VTQWGCAAPQGHHPTPCTLAGHALVTWLAVWAGKWIGGRISEKLLYRLSGGLFLAFALISLQQALS